MWEIKPISEVFKWFFWMWLLFKLFHHNLKSSIFDVWTFEPIEISEDHSADFFDYIGVFRLFNFRLLLNLRFDLFLKRLFFDTEKDLVEALVLKIKQALIEFLISCFTLVLILKWTFLYCFKERTFWSIWGGSIVDQMLRKVDNTFAVLIFEKIWVFRIHFLIENLFNVIWFYKL